MARNLVEQPRDPQKNGKNDGGSAQRSGRLRWAEVLARYELWDDLIAATDSGALDWSDVPLERKEKAYTLGLAYAAKGDQAKLAEQIDALKALAAEEAKSPHDGGSPGRDSATASPQTRRPWPSWKVPAPGQGRRRPGVRPASPRRPRCDPRRWPAPT